MKKVIFFLTAIFFIACQQPKQQYFESSPEIDSVKRSIQAFLNQDWAAFRSTYADSAKIAANTSDKGKFLNNDQHIEEEKALFLNFTDMKIENTVYNMVITDKEEKWVLLWFDFSAKTKGGVEVNVTGHEKFLFVDGKVVFQKNFYDNLPIYISMQTTDSTGKQ